MVVPTEVLTPPEVGARGVDATDLAYLLDHWLRRLASQEARCRTILGRLARAFLRRHGVERLGFARLDDYARERLGISGRELQSMVRVGKAPLLRFIGDAYAA